MLGSEVDVVDGNLEEPQAGHTATGGPRSLVLLNPAPDSGASSRKAMYWEPLSSSLQPGEHGHSVLARRTGVFSRTHIQGHFLLAFDEPLNALRRG